MVPWPMARTAVMCRAMLRATTARIQLIAMGRYGLNQKRPPLDAKVLSTMLVAACSNAR